jgi:hypothetical protein
MKLTEDELTQATQWWSIHSNDTFALMKHKNVCLVYTDYEGTITNGNRQMVVIALLSKPVDESVRFPSHINGVPIRIKCE